MSLFSPDANAVIPPNQRWNFANGGDFPQNCRHFVYAFDYHSIKKRFAPSIKAKATKNASKFRSPCCALVGENGNGSAEKLLSTQQVADGLGVSRPFVVKLIDGGQLPAQLVGTHWRVRARTIWTFTNISGASNRALRWTN